MRSRQPHETDTGHLPSGGGLTGAQRRTEIRALADQLGPGPADRTQDQDPYRRSPCRSHGLRVGTGPVGSR
ncbi:hypothetical protein GCM10017687_68120 [Streptomyces echinatus]